MLMEKSGNISKSLNIVFTLKKDDTVAVHFNNATIPVKNMIKYLKISFVRSLTYKESISKKRKELFLNLKKCNCFKAQIQTGVG